MFKQSESLTKPPVPSHVPRTSHDQKQTDKVIREALAGIVDLDFRRATAGTGVSVKTDAGSPLPRYGASSVVYRGKVYMFGGAGDADFKEPVLFNDTWVLSLSSNRDRLGSVIDNETSLGSVGYMWQKVPLRSQVRPPSCAFHLAAVHDGHMYVYISQCLLGAETVDWLGPTTQSLTSLYDNQSQFYNEAKRAETLTLKAQAVNAFRKRSQRSLATVNQLWRLDLDCKYPEWEELDLTVTKGMTHLTRGGIAMHFYDSRLFVYGVVTSTPFVCIGVLDINLRRWLTWVRLPGAPVW